ncbi:MAG: DUF3106 domain-containing protein [Rhodocyclaceae bacterium]|nr:DUF3106 domain-containing protein [Rhodocyclaceae bacterium]
MLLSPAQAVVPELGQPAWIELTQEQKQILAPLARDWDKMEAFRKKKWLGIAKRYPTMKPEEQARVQRRIKDWASLTPEQRTQARVQYKNLKTAPPERKEAIKEKWEQYSELPDEEKKRLAEKAARKPLAKSPKSTPKLPATTLHPLPTAAVPPPTPAATPKEISTSTAQPGVSASVWTPEQPAPATPVSSAPPASQQ